MNTRIPSAHKALFLCWILSAAGLASCGSSGPSGTGAATASRNEPRNVVFVCLDTVRADRLGCYGYGQRPTTPALDALALRSTLFADASAAAGWTKPSVPSFLTGTYPLQHGVYEGSARGSLGKSTDLLPPEATTLAELFGARGFATAAFVHNAQLRRGTGMEQGFDLYEDQAGDARDIRERAEEWLDARPADRPFFLYLHFLDAHWPYPVPDDYAARFASPEAVAPFRGKDSRALLDAINDGERTLAAGELDALGALYDGALRYLDDELGRLLARLERDGLLANTVVCVLADHGEEFLEHGRIGHGHGLWENLLRVPWILYVPEREPVRVTNPVALVDVFATVAAAAGIPSGSTHVGIDRLAAPDRERPIFAEHKGGRRYQQSWRDGSRKLVRQLSFSPPADWSFEPEEALAVGTRWNVALLDDGPPWTALELEPSTDDVGDPLEWKGPVTRSELGDGGVQFEIAGVRASLEPECELYGECRGDEEPAEVLTPGRLVKVKGHFEDGVLVAEKIKVYAPGETARLEVRGVVEAVGRREGVRSLRSIRIGDFEIDYDGRVEWDLEDEDLPSWSPALADLHSAARALADGEMPADLESRLSVFDLAADPGEQRALELGSLEGDLGRDSQKAATSLKDLDRAALGLAATALEEAGSRSRLSDAALAELRALGYVE